MASLHSAVKQKITPEFPDDSNANSRSSSYTPRAQAQFSAERIIRYQVQRAKAVGHRDFFQSAGRVEGKMTGSIEVQPCGAEDRKIQALDVGNANHKNPAGRETLRGVG